MLTIAGIDPDLGGPSASIPALLNGLRSIAVDAGIVSLRRRDILEVLKPKEPSGCELAFAQCPTEVHWKLRWAPKFRKLLLEQCQLRSVQIIHDNGIWLPTNHTAAKVAKAVGCFRIVSPRGMLSSWAVRFKGFKKYVAWQLYQKRDLDSASLLHATSDFEALVLRKTGLKQPVAVIPNGVVFEQPSIGLKSESKKREIENLLPLGSFRKNDSQLGPNRTALFLSRIHPVKGLPILVQAWAEQRPTNWRLVIAGSDVNKHRIEIERLVASYGLERDVEFISGVQEKDKWKLYRQADLFILPSYSENFGIVVAEALAAGVPVITTKGTPWEDLDVHRCGWWINIGVEPLVKALIHATSISDQERLDMGQRGRQLVEAKYTWPQVAQQMKSVYEWLLGMGPKPVCVV